MKKPSHALDGSHVFNSFLFQFQSLITFEFCLFRLIYKSGINQANSLIHITVLTTLVEFKISTEETYSSISKKETQDKLLAS